MNLDIRLPIGLLFLILGGLLTVLGVITMGDKALYEHSLGYNINLLWGVALLVFGAAMTYFGTRGGTAGAEPAAATPGAATAPRHGH